MSISLYPFMFKQLLLMSSILVFMMVQQNFFPQGNALPLIKEFQVPQGTHPHDVAPAANGSVWYTAQGSGELGLLNPFTNKTFHIALGIGSAPHGVIVGPDKAPWITDGGLNGIVRVDPKTKNVTLFPFLRPLAMRTSIPRPLIGMEFYGLPVRVGFTVDWIQGLEQ